MTIYFEDFEYIVKRLEEDHITNESYLNSLREVDFAITEFISENQYTNRYYWQNRFLLEKFLGKELLEWIEWYLYELPIFRPEEIGTANCTINNVNYLVTDLESFMDFARHGLCLPMKPGTNIEDEETT